MRARLAVGVALLAMAVSGAGAPAYGQDDTNKPPNRKSLLLPDQGWYDERFDIEYWRKLTDSEKLRGSYDWYMKQLRSAEMSAETPTNKNWRQAQIDDLREMLDVIRQALGERGERPRGEMVRNTQKIPVPQREGTGSNTRATRTPGQRPGGPSFVAPVAIFATAGELASCASEGLSAVDCAKKMALDAAIALPIGAVITVLSPLGTPILTAFAVAGAAGSLVIASTQAAANLDQMAQQRANAERVTPEQINAIVQAYEMRIAQARVDPNATRQLTDAVAGMARVVRQARGDSDAFREQNSAAKLAVAACTDPKRQPLPFANAATRVVQDMQRVTGTMVQSITTANALLTACSAENARGAREAYDKATKDLSALQQMAIDGREDIQNALKFFATIKLGRASMQEAAKRIAALERAIPAAVQAHNAIRDAIAAYGPALQAHQAAVMSVYIGLTNLRGAFPSNPPPHIAAGLAKIDAAYTREAANVITRDRLIAIDQSALDDVSRVEGFHRLAREQFDDLRACGQVTGDVPVPLGQDLARLGEEINAQLKRGQDALAAGKDIPGKAEVCRRATATPDGDGILTGRCRGTIEATPPQGKPGTQLRLRVRVAAPEASQVTRVEVDNPGCQDARCRSTQPIGSGLFETWLAYQAPANAQPTNGTLGTFRVRFNVFAGSALLCSGSSPLLTVLPR